MRKEKVVIWGASGHALVVADIIRMVGKYEIAGFLDNVSSQRKGEVFCGSRILGGVEELDNLLKNGVRNIIFGFGNCEARFKLSVEVRKKGFVLVNAIHPSAVIAKGAVLGHGVVICAGVVINPSVKIGNNAIINTSSSIDHEGEIDEAVHLCPGVRLAGQVSVGKRTWVGIGSIVKEKVKIGSDVFIGAGSLVLKDIPDNVLVYGSPVKVIGNIK